MSKALGDTLDDEFFNSQVPKQFRVDEDWDPSILPIGVSNLVSFEKVENIDFFEELSEESLRSISLLNHSQLIRLVKLLNRRMIDSLKNWEGG